MNRARQRSTVDSSTPRSAATCLFVPPSAQRSTIFARIARNWAVFARRAHRDQLRPLRLGQDQLGLRPADRRGVLQPGQPLAPRTGAATCDTVLTATPSACAAPAFDIPRHTPG